MKYNKIFILIFNIFILSGCGNNKSDIVQNSSTQTEMEESQNTEESEEIDNSSDTIVIGEKMFLTQITDIYYNFDNYKDKKIVVEGMYTLFYNQDGVKNMPVVYRNAPGCCGNDGWGGFFLKYDGEFPQDNDWIRVTGTPELVENGNFVDLYLNVEKIEVLDERGEEFVIQ